MRRWSYYGWYERAPMQPPPERGIRMKKAGTTWWGERWIEALQTVLRGDSARLGRGRTYARSGRAHDLVVAPGRVTAKVSGTRPKPYSVTITLVPLDDAAWEKVIAGMAAKAQFAAELLAGAMPQSIDEVFRGAGVSLFPSQRADLVTSCSCPDWGDPCKHVAATHYILGEAFDRDPFLLFELRGRTKEQVLAALRGARGAVGAPPRKRKPKRATAEAPAPEVPVEVPSVSLAKVKAADYDRPRAPLPSLHFTLAAPGAGAAVLRQLGEPATWDGAGSPSDSLAPVVRAAAETARRLALAERSAPPPSDLPSPPARRAKKRRAARRGR